MAALPKAKRAAKPKQPAATEFEAVADYMVRVITRAPDDAAASEYNRVPQVLKRQIYGYVRSIRHRSGVLEQLQTHIRHRDRGRVPLDPENPFLLGLRLIEPFVDGELEKGRRSKYAAELRYADLHNVAPKLLTAFLASVGSYELIKRKLDAGERESWVAPFRKAPPAAEADDDTDAS